MKYGFNHAVAALMAAAFGATAQAAPISPDIIFGSGNANGSFTVVTVSTGRGDIELGLRAKLRYNDSGSPENTFNWDGTDTYTFAQTSGTPSNRSVFNYEWSINSSDAGTISNLLGLGAYALIEYDTDSTASTSFSSYNPFAFDAYYGTNATPNGGGTYSVGTPVSGSTVAQNSVNYGFLPGAPIGPGVYDVRLSVFSGNNTNLGSTAIVINSSPVPVPVPATIALMGLGLAGLGWMRRRQS